MSAALRSLLAESVDYAGLFPPASLSMAAAVEEYAAHRREPAAWMLGRFVVPAARLDEWERTATAHIRDAPWRLAVLAPSAEPALAATIAGFNERHAGHAIIDTAELRAVRVDDVPDARALGDGVTIYVELPLADDPDLLLQAIARCGVRAKIRTGGVTADAIPTVAQVARFIRRSVERGVSFKATAGLHHPLRAEYPLTYEADAERGTMFGFLNVFLATVLARAGGSEQQVAALLEERDPAAFTFSDEHVVWRGRSLPHDALRHARGAGIASFGSCSFREPVADLRALGLL